MWVNTSENDFLKKTLPFACRLYCLSILHSLFSTKNLLPKTRQNKAQKKKITDNKKTRRKNIRFKGENDTGIEIGAKWSLGLKGSGGWSPYVMEALAGIPGFLCATRNSYVLPAAPGEVGRGRWVLGGSSYAIRLCWCPGGRWVGGWGGDG